MKTQTLKNIYESNPIWGNCHNIGVKIKGYSDVFTLDLINIHDRKPDCCIGHFGYNFYIRTPYGVKNKKYKTPATLRMAIIKVLKNNGLEVEYFTFKNKIIKL